MPPGTAIPPATQNCEVGHEMESSSPARVTIDLVHAPGPSDGASDTITSPPLVTTAQKFIVGQETPAKLSSVGIVTCWIHAPVNGEVEA